MSMQPPNAILQTLINVEEIVYAFDSNNKYKLLAFVGRDIIGFISDSDLDTFGVTIERDEAETYPNTEGYELVSEEDAQKFLAIWNMNIMLRWRKVSAVLNRTGGNN